MSSAVSLPPALVPVVKSASAITIAVTIVVTAIVIGFFAFTQGDEPVSARPSSVAESLAAPEALPARIPGYEMTPVGQRTYRISLVFRMRNAILNGLSGPGSSYTITTRSVRRGALAAIIIGVRANPETSLPNVPQELAQMIALTPRAHVVVAGTGITIFRAAGYSLGLLDVGPRRAIVVIAERSRDALDLGRAAAQSIATS